MPLYVSFRRALHSHTTVWYEPLEEENIGHGGRHGTVKLNERYRAFPENLSSASPSA